MVPLVSPLVMLWLVVVPVEMVAGLPVACVANVLDELHSTM